MNVVYTWSDDDEFAGIIDFQLLVREDGSGVMTVNGQGYLPIAAEVVPALLANLKADGDVQVRDYPLDSSES